MAGSQTGMRLMREGKNKSRVAVTIWDTMEKFIKEAIRKAP